MRSLSSVQGEWIRANPNVAQAGQHTLINREECLEQVLSTAEVNGAVERKMTAGLGVDLATSKK